MSRTAKYRSWNDFLSVFAYFEDGEYWYDYDGKHFLRGFHAFDWDNAEQYTGLKDKNGVEIYEGDVVYLAGFGELIVEDFGFELWDAVKSGNGEDIGSIIGNIHTLDTNT